MNPVTRLVTWATTLLQRVGAGLSWILSIPPSVVNNRLRPALQAGAKRLRAEPLQTSSIAIAVVGVARLVVVSDGRPTTMAALLQHTSFPVIGVSLALLALFGAGVWTGLLAARWTRRHWASSGFLGKAGLVVAWVVLFVAGFFLSSVEPGLSAFAATSVLVAAYYFLFLGVVVPNSAWFRDLVLLVAGVIVGLLTLGVVIGFLWDPWHEREILEIGDATTIDGYVLEDFGRWATVMLHDDRVLVQVEVDDIETRQPYTP